jgi:hypothetical protein
MRLPRISKYVILGAVMLYFPVIFSQENNVNPIDKDFRKFQEALQKETQTETQDTIVRQPVLPPASLPGWLFEIPASNQKQIFTIGISDPGMQEDKAFELAHLRARSVIALLLHPKITGITDNYSKEYTSGSSDKFTTKYENLFRISSNLIVLENNIEQIEGFYTAFGEAIVLLKYNLTGADLISDSVVIVTEVYQVERQKNNSFETEEKIGLNYRSGITGDTSMDQGYSYSIHTLNNLLEINSEWNGEDILFPYFKFRYLGNLEKDLPDSDNNLSARLNYGLWKTYIEILIQKILMLSQSYSVAVKQVGDNQVSENKTLSREISEADPSFTITGMRIVNNYLSLDVDYLNQQQ